MSRRRRRAPGLPPALFSLSMAVAAGATAAELPVAARAVTALPGEVVFGVPSPEEPSVGLLVYERLECAATLIGCRTAVTAAHCLCYDPAFEPPRLLLGDECRGHASQLDPAGKRLFFQHAGWFEVEGLEVHPGWDESGGDDLAILRLDRPVTGVRPAEINDLAPVPKAVPGQVVAFGRTLRDRADQGIKRVGDVTFGGCAGDFLCWWLLAEPEADDSRSGLCFHDSGGAVFADLAGGGADRRLVGVNHSTTSPSCQAPSFNLATDLYSRREWLAGVAGADLGPPPGTDASRGCGGLAAAGGAEGRIRGSTGRLSADRTEAGFFLEVPPGTGLLRVTLTTTGRAEPADNDFDLYLARGAIPRPDEPDRRLDCASRGPSGIEVCEVLGPEPGHWYAVVRRVRGEGRYQLVATQLDGEPPAGPPEPEDPDGPETPEAPGPHAPAPPPPPELPWLAAPGLPGFEVKVRIGTTAGASVADCVPETLCVSGALAGRPELFVKVVGPRPNGHLWVQVARFTPSPAEVWLRRIATGRVNHYLLGPVGPASPGVPGLQDRRAFPE